MTKPLDLFSFGTLMDTDLLSLVCEQAVDNLVLDAAVVPDHARRWVLDDAYPVLVPETGRVTEGLIIRGLSEYALERIIFFEGEEFELKPIDVQRPQGDWERVQYFADTHRKEISDTEWSLEGWRHSTKADTMPRVTRYMQCFGKMSRAEADAYW